MPTDQWQIGDVKITRILEGESAGPMFLLPDATKENIQAMPWLQPHFADKDGNCIISIHALVLDTPKKTIVVDTCLGNDKERAIKSWGHLQTKFIEDITNAGYPPGSIDIVLCTHLHTDHVGWNTKLVDGKWVPTFENAQYIFGQEEWKYTDEQRSNPMYNEFIVDSIQPVIDAGLVRFVDVNEQICDWNLLRAIRPVMSVFASNQKTKKQSLPVTFCTIPAKWRNLTGSVLLTGIPPWRKRLVWRVLGSSPMRNYWSSALTSLRRRQERLFVKESTSSSRCDHGPEMAISL
jgi:hypothetical protein